MATAQELFKSTVIKPLEINIHNRTFSYADYLALPNTQRSNDEADVVDSKFTLNVLQWLGYDTGDIIYNRPLPGQPGDKPDYVIKMLGATAFIVEDKSTDEHFNTASIKQLRRYTAGTSGYCLWTNAQSILALRFDANGHYQTLVEVRVDGVFGHQKLPFSQEANFEILHLLFRKKRFEDITTLIKEVSIGESEWMAQAKPLTDELSLRAFTDESRYVLDQLVTTIKARLNTVTIDLDEAMKDFTDSQQKYAMAVTDLIEKLRGNVNPNILKNLEIQLRLFEPVLADIDVLQIERLKPTMSAATATSWTNRIQEIGATIAALRERELSRIESRRIRDAYLLWRERYRIIESEDGGTEDAVESRRQQAFAEQVSYVFFVRLLLTRVLEDKGIMPHLVSDGGFKEWHKFLQGYAIDNVDEIGGESFLPLVYRRVAGFYRHFFQQPVFDWFLPDDYLLALVLHHLNQYNFKDVTSDLLGFTYQAFIDRVARNKKGHFLTPPAVVEYMLDQAGYTHSSVIGEGLLDTACGSGSFLVHATRRLKRILTEAMPDKSPTELARTFIQQVQTNIVGLEINPFSCYLAELNLFIQVLDDLALLWQSNEQPQIERFAIYNSNSLEMPQSVLHSGRDTTATAFEDYTATLDEAYAIKVSKGQFGYVLCNPPYINRGIILGAKSYGDFPFFRDVVKGDENFYLLFLRLAAYYVSPGGTICFICPLNLIGDESTMPAREMFNGAAWQMQSITRFYARDILFSSVLQGVCIVRFDQTPSQATDLVEVHGGFTVEEAASTATQIQKARVTNNYPIKTTWTKPWLVNTHPTVYDLWEYIRENSVHDLKELLQGKMKAYKGDVRSTWAKPMLVTGPGKQVVPLTKGKNISDWGSWTAAAYLNPSVTIPATSTDYRSSLWVQKQIQRVVNLAQSETALFLKEVSGLEMRRPIRGTIIQRDRQHVVAADETLLVIYTLDPSHEDLAFATFGLLTSLTYNFFFSLFSTNAHANFKEILRLPVPTWSTSLERQLAEETRNVLHAYHAKYAHETLYGAGQAQEVSLHTVLLATKLPTLRLEELILRGDVALNTSSHFTLEVLLNRGQFSMNSRLTAEATHTIERFVRANGTLTYAKGGKDIVIPNPRVAGLFLTHLHTIEQEREALLHRVYSSQRGLDEMILDMYGINQPSWRDIISNGVPWAKN